MNAGKRTGIIFIILAALTFSGCLPAAAPEAVPEPTEAPTALPSHTPEPTPSPTPEYIGVWQGTWNVWAGTPGESDEIVKIQKIDFMVEGNRVSMEMLMAGENRTVEAEISDDGVTALGSWRSEDGRSGTASMLISEDRLEFAGNLDGEVDFCGSRSQTERPSPCFTEITGNWDGKWTVWSGAEDVEIVMVLQQEGNEVDVMIYDISGTVSEDGRTLTGEISEMGFTGKLEAGLLDNQAQFTGNVSGIIPFCGARPGGPKPEPCIGP